MVVHKDIHSSWPPTQPPPPLGALLLRTGTLKAEASAGSEDDMSRPSQSSQSGRAEIVGKADSSDNIFMDDVSIFTHCGTVI